MNLENKQSLDEFTDRELLMFILSNQVSIYRDICILQNKILGDNYRGDLGHNDYQFAHLLKQSDETIRVSNEYLKVKHTDREF